MSDDGLGSLDENDVRQVVLLIESLERSTFDFLHVQVGGLTVAIGKGEPPVPGAAPPTPSPVVDAAPATAPAAVAAVPAAEPPAAAVPAAVAEPAAVDAPGAVEIRSPMMGVFYAQREPGAPAFVSVGSVVEPDTTVALVEVMKTFNAVTAKVKGTVVEVCVQDTQLVEYGQVLFRVDPSD